MGFTEKVTFEKECDINSILVGIVLRDRYSFDYQGHYVTTHFSSLRITDCHVDSSVKRAINFFNSEKNGEHEEFEVKHKQEF